MPDLVVPAAVRVVCEGTLGGRACVNTYGVHTAALAQSAGLLAQIRDVFWNVHNTNLRPLFSDAWALKEVEATALDSATGPQVRTIGNLVGTKANGGAPQIAQIVKLTTTVRARFARGRVYLPPPGEADVNSIGDLTTQQVADVTAAVGQIQTQLSALGCNLAIISRTTSSVWPVTGIACQTKVGTQRRRLR